MLAREGSSGSCVKNSTRPQSIRRICASLVIYAAAGQAAIAQSTAEEIRWREVSACTDLVDVELFLIHFPESRHTEAAMSCKAWLILQADEGPGENGEAAANGAEQVDQPAQEPAQPAEIQRTELVLPRQVARTAQAHLTALGFDPGPTDGIWGPKSRSAYNAFLSNTDAAGLPTNRPDSRALDVLRRLAETKGRKVELTRRVSQPTSDAEVVARLPGSVFRDCEGCPEMVVVPAGSFDMGSPPGEPGRHGNEGPVHRVRIVNSFAIGKYEVTRQEFARFLQESGHAPIKRCWTIEGSALFNSGRHRNGRNWANPSFSQSPLDPVVCVSWMDAQAFVKWLSVETGKPYRLPSEAEWEFAARAGTSASRYWGDDASLACRYENVSDAEVRKKYFDWSFHNCSDGNFATSSRGQFMPNPFGLYDILGNAGEWVEDCWRRGYRDAPTDGSALTVGGDCSQRVARGGSWGSGPRIARAAKRHHFGLEEAFYEAGFRVARSLHP